MRLTRHFAPKLVAVVSLFGWAALAQPPQQFPDPQQQQQQQDGDIPDADSASRGVARISLMNGDVSVRRGDNGDFVAAALNAPLMAGDRILTGPNSRAEVQFDSANMIRIGSDAEIRLSELADRHYQIQLARGLATFRVLRPSQADVEVSTPQVSIRPRNQGVYRLMVRDDGQSEVTVRAGEVEIFTPRGVETLHAGRTMQVRGTASDPEFQIVGAQSEDEWDRWNTGRDQVMQRAASPRYVNPDVYGTEDLDQYGRWVPDPTYGNVWAPQVAAGWAPYREGRWVWMDYYGWTWVSYDPWGWAPYHYGRWYQSPAYGWCWYPGSIGFGRHYWSPALVGFIGFGHGGVGFGFGNVGWVPLAPYERFHPWYGRGFAGGRGASINVNVYSSYRNARIRNGVTAVDGAGFARGASGRAFTGDIRQASVVRGQLPVTPNRDSMRLSDRSVRPGIQSRTTDNQRFFSSRQTTPAGGRSMSQPRVSGPGLNQGSQNPSAGRGQQSQGGWRRFGEPTGGASTPRTVDRGASAVQGSRSGQGASNNGGWGRFGEPSARPQQQSQQSRPAPDSYGGRQGYGGRPPVAAAPQSQSPRYSGGGANPNQNRYQPPANIDRGSAYRGGGGNQPQPLRISPPMVRERSAAPPARSESRPSSGNSGGSRSSGGGNSGGSRGSSNSHGGRNR